MAENKMISSHFQGYTVPAPGCPAEATFQVNILGARFTVHTPEQRDFDESRAVRFIIETALLTEKKELAEHLRDRPRGLQAIRDAWHTWSKSRELRKHLRGYSRPRDWETLLEEMP